MLNNGGRRRVEIGYEWGHQSNTQDHYGASKQCGVSMK